MSEQQFTFLATLAERMHSTASVSMIYGAPIEAQGKVIIPVARIAYGLGGEYGKHTATTGGGQLQPHPWGESDGGRILVAPLGIMEGTSERTRFVPLRSRRAAWVGAALGSVVGAVVYALLRRHPNSFRYAGATRCTCLVRAVPCGTISSVPAKDAGATRRGLPVH